VKKSDKDEISERMKEHIKEWER